MRPFSLSPRAYYAEPQRMWRPRFQARIMKTPYPFSGCRQAAALRRRPNACAVAMSARSVGNASGRLGSAIAGDAAKLDLRPGFAQDIVPQFVAPRIFKPILGLAPLRDRNLQRLMPAPRPAPQARKDGL